VHHILLLLLLLLVLLLLLTRRTRPLLVRFVLLFVQRLFVL